MTNPQKSESHSLCWLEDWFQAWLDLTRGQSKRFYHRERWTTNPGNGQGEAASGQEAPHEVDTPGAGERKGGVLDYPAGASIEPEFP